MAVRDDRDVATLSDKVEKTECEDSDLILLGNQGSSSYRKITWANIINSLKTKFLTWLFSDLNTTDKTVIGAINEINSDMDGYLPLTGGTLTNTGSSILGIVSGGTSGDTGMSVTSWSGNKIWLGVGSGGANRGVYDSTGNGWIVYRDSNKDVYLNTGIGTVFKPYYAAGDTISVSVNTAGYVTSSGTSLRFTVPLSRPIIGSPTRTVTGDFCIRQNNAYCYGSSSSVTVSPSSISSTITPSGLYINATFDNTTNITNNSPIGINVTLSIILS